MKLKHRIAFNDQTKIRITLEKKLGCPIKRGAIISVLEMDENHPLWPKVAQVIKGVEVVHSTEAVFNKREMETAPWLRLQPSWHHGYPMPDDDFGYLNLSFDLAGYDPNSGIGKIQKSPFRMKAEPRWGKMHFLQLNWEFGTFFVKPKIWKDYFKPLGIPCLQVLKYGPETPLDTVVQLMPQQLIPFELDMKGYPLSEDGLKYNPATTGFFPKPHRELQQNLHYIQTLEYFGSGASAHQAILVSSEFYKIVRENQLQGVSFVPTQ